MKLALSVKYLYRLVLVLCGLVFLSGINLDILGVDAAQYASISKEMSETGNYLQVMHRGTDYLDKPPLLFWLSAGSFELFGVSNWAYRLPSILFIFLGIYSTMRLGRLLYDKTVGYLAGIVFATTQAIFLISHDVRTDTILVSAVVFATWGIIEYVETNRWKYLILGFIGVGLAMLSKGPIGLMVPALALGTHFLIKRQWNRIFKWQWLVGLAITALIISPMVYGLYEQFDAHPEKITRLSSNRYVESISGLNFYFWEQSFGRLTGESEWDNGGPWHFFLGIFCWSFLPWTILGIGGIVSQLKAAFRTPKLTEFYTLGGILLPFAALSLSKFKLDHYIYVIYPFVAILTARFIVSLATQEKLRPYLWIQIGLGGIVAVGICLIQFGVFPSNWGVFIFSFLFIALALSAFLWKRNILLTLIITASLSIIGANFYLKQHFFNTLAQYDGSIQAGKFLAAQNTNPKQHYLIGVSAHAFEFYSGAIVPFGHWSDQQDWTGMVIYTGEKGYAEMKEKKIKPKDVVKFKYFNTTSLNTRFLNPSTRSEAIEYVYLIFF